MSVKITDYALDRGLQAATGQAVAAASATCAANGAAAAAQKDLAVDGAPATGIKAGDWVRVGGATYKVSTGISGAAGTLTLAVNLAAAVADDAVVTIISSALRLHTNAEPKTTNEVTNSTYTAVPVAPADWGRDTLAGYRRLKNTAEWVFYADAASGAPTSQSIGYWHGATLAWSWDEEVDPANAKVAAAVDALTIGVQEDADTWSWTETGVDRFLRAMAGEAFAAGAIYFALHNTSGEPDAANLVTGGGLLPWAAVGWTLATVEGFRRASQGAKTLPALTGALSATPNRIAMWLGSPSQSGVLLGYRKLAGVNPSGAGSVISFEADELFFGIEASVIGAG